MAVPEPSDVGDVNFRNRSTSQNGASSFPQRPGSPLRRLSRCRSHGRRLFNAAHHALPLIPPPTLLKDGLATLCKNSELSVFDALEPVAEAPTDACKERVDPEGLFCEDRTHLNAELPKSDGDACTPDNMLAPRRRGRGGMWPERTEAAPEKDFVNHNGV